MKVFFDVDGVLIDGWHADFARRKPWDVTIEADLGVDRDAFQLLFFGNPAKGAASPMFECVTGRRDLKEALAAVLPQTGYKGGVDDFVRYWFEKDSNINPEVFDLVRKLRERGAQTFVATGQEHHRAAYLWNELHFANHFDRLFYSAEIGVPKKDPRFFEAINRALEIDPEERPLFFDDQPEIVELASRAGWDAAIFTSARNIQKHPRLRDLWV
ncbi:HAD-IA family hydrolase [Ensifer sp. 22521]|uniref:HAD-IA family hydrolase n=1 Tax=Ensifer sp. 22521 TaxID=3453935 RepID=UPI003F870EA6